MQILSILFVKQIIKEETDQTRTIHDKLLSKLNQERGKAEEIEESLSLNCEALKKQVKEESRARTILQVGNHQIKMAKHQCEDYIH